MLLDLTVRPVQIHPDECPRSLIIRTLGTGTLVTGFITKDEDVHGYRVKNHKRQISPMGQIPHKNGRTLRETRLPLEQTPMAKGRPVLAEPYLISCAYKDTSSGKHHVSDISIFLEYTQQNSKVSVTVQDGSRMLLTVVTNYMRGRGMIGSDELTPIQRLLHKQAHGDGPMNAWERMLAD